MEENFDMLQVLDRLRVLKLEYLKLNIRAILKNNFECLSWILNLNWMMEWKEVDLIENTYST